MMQYIPNLHVPHLRNGTEKEAKIEQPLNAEVANAHRKRKAEEDTGAGSKRRRSSDSAEDSLPCFEPAALVSAKEGTFKVPQSMQRYLDKHLKRCLTKEEVDAVFKEHPRPDLSSCLAPAVDKYMRDFLGKRLPKSGDADLYKVQKSVLSVIRPMTSAWQMLEEGGLRDDPDLLVPAAEVLSFIERTMCLVGNTSELISQTRRARILEAVDPSWSKYGSEEFPSSSSTLFGEGFQETLSKRVEKDMALSKAVSIMKRAKRTEEPSPARPLFSGPISIQDEPSTSSLLQLEARPEGMGSGCPVNPVGTDESLHVPSIYPHSTVPQQAGDGQGVRLANCSSMAQPSVVSSTAEVPDGCSSALATYAGHTHGPNGSSPSISSEGPPTLGRVACVRRDLQERGFSEGLVTIIRQSWRGATEASYSSAWRMWVGWCCGRGTDPISAPLSEILEFLLVQFQEESDIELLTVFAQQYL